MRVVGHRGEGGNTFDDQRRLARTAAFLRGTAALVSRGVYRFASFDEADAWMTEMLLRTHEHQSRRISSASAAR